MIDKWFLVPECFRILCLCLIGVEACLCAVCLCLMKRNR